MPDNDTNLQANAQAPAKPEPVQNAVNPAVPSDQGTAPAGQVAQPAQMAQQAVDQTKKAAEEAAAKTSQAAQQAAGEAAKQAGQVVGTGLQQGVEQLKKMDFKSMLKTQANQPKVTGEEKIWSLVSYIPMVALLALLIRPDSKFIRLHGRQGLLIFIIFFFCIFLYLIPYIGPLFAGLIQFALFVIGIFSMYQALLGNWWKIPVLGDLAEMIPVELFTQVAKEAVTGQPVEEQKAMEEQKSEQAGTVQAESTAGPAQTINQNQQPTADVNPPAGPQGQSGNLPPQPPAAAK